MIAVTELSSSGQQPSATQLQMQLIVSSALAQRIKAMPSSDATSDSSTGGSGAKPQAAEQYIRSQSSRTRQSAEQTQQTFGDSTARSVVEAQEEATNNTITAAFQARHAMIDLLSVIRDPEDKMLPHAPSDVGI